MCLFHYKLLLTTMFLTYSYLVYPKVFNLVLVFFPEAYIFLWLFSARKFSFILLSCISGILPCVS